MTSAVSHSPHNQVESHITLLALSFGTRQCTHMIHSSKPFFSSIPTQKTPLRPLISHRLQNIFWVRLHFHFNPHHIEPFYCCVFTPAPQRSAKGKSRRHKAAHLPPPHPRSRKTLQSSPHPLPSASPSKPAQPPLTRRPKNAPPPPPLEQHVVLGRCLQLCLQQAAADAAGLRLRQLRRDGEMRCRRLLCALGVHCTWLVTLFPRRLLRFAPALGRAGPCFGGGGG